MVSSEDRQEEVSGAMDAAGNGSGCRRLKVLISAYACDPDAGSEPGMGWHWIRNLAQHHDLWVLTEENRYAAALGRGIERNPDLKGKVHVIPVWRHRYGEQLWSRLYYLSYRQWQWKAYRLAKELHKHVAFDLVHQLNMIGYREPGYLWKLDVPFLWGPIGGHTQMPWAFVRRLDRGGFIQYSTRNILNSVQMRISVRVRRAARRASALFAATSDDRTALWKIHGRSSLLVPEVGANLPVGNLRGDGEAESTPGTLRLIWCGRHVDGKALYLGLHALRRALDRGISASLDIVGDGPCSAVWKETAIELRLSDHCSWHGALAHERALAAIANGDALLFTSVQDATATVVIEALQSGVPVICHDACGFGGIIDSSCGIKVPCRNPSVSIEGFANAIIELASSPTMRHRLAAGALERAKAMTWQLKAAEISGVYQAVFDNRSR